MNLKNLETDIVKDEPLKLKPKVIKLNENHCGSENNLNYDEDYYYRVYGAYPDDIDSRHPYC